MATTLQEAINQFRQPVYVRTKRNDASYAATSTYVCDNVRRLVELYRNTKNDEQTKRLIRDDIDNALRRYHGYCIKENFGSHYIQKGLEGNGIFEHMVPNSTIRDMLLHGIISPEQACNMPTCRLSVESDNELKRKGWNTNTPDIWNFWKRYEFCFEVVGNCETWDGTAVDPKMTLADHFAKFL